MNRFLHGHATHPDWRTALALAGAQIDAQRAAGPAGSPTLGWVYLTDHFAPHAGPMLAELRTRWPGVQWVGASGGGIAASGVEYFDEPALALMLAELPRERFRVFSGAHPLGDFVAHSANVHADPVASDLAGLIADMSARTTTGYLFGGLASARTQPLHIAEAVLTGGLSGVAFDAGVTLVSRVTQGCQPVGPRRRVSAAERNLVSELDGEPALDCLLRDLNLAGIEPRAALPRLRQVLVGLGDPAGQEVGGHEDSTTRSRFGDDTRVRHLIGLDPGRRGLAISDVAEVGTPLAFCTRDVEAARRDLTRICAEVRDELEPESLPLEAALIRHPATAGTPGSPPGASNGIAGAVYVSCAGRGGPHFGAPSAELAIVRHALGDVPLVGFFAAGEIARRHLYGYTGVLTVFTQVPR
jgi:small ligand-binding sensory domain FIST